MSRAVDPGWGEAVKRVPMTFLPTRGMRMALGSDNGLTVMRIAWLAFSAVMVVIGSIVVAIDLAFPAGGADGRVVGVAVAGVSVFMQLVSVKFVPEIAGDTMPVVRATVQRAFFIRVGFAQPAVLVGFMGFVLSGNVAVFAIGFVLGAVGMYDTSPTSGWIAKGQQLLRDSGSDVELLDALVSGGITR